MPSALRPHKEESRELGAVNLYGETEKLLKELGSTRLTAVPTSPLPSLVSVCVHLHAFATQEGFTLKAEFLANRRLFKCTRFRNQSQVDVGQALCDAFYEVIKISRGWTVGWVMLDHSHAMEKDSASQLYIRKRWNNLQLEKRGTRKRESNGEYGRHQRRVLRKRETHSSRRCGSGSSGESESDSDSNSSESEKTGLKASHWNFPMTQQVLVEEANAILSKVILLPKVFRPELN